MTLGGSIADGAIEKKEEKPIFQRKSGKVENFTVVRRCFKL